MPIIWFTISFRKVIQMKIKTKEIILVSLFTALTAIGAFIKIPMKPAPITLQFLFTALAGMMLGAKLGSLSQLVYILLGLIGIPIFTEGGGISYVMKPTFGYLIGFVVAAYVIGKISEKNSRNSVIMYFAACVLGLAATYAIGVPYLYLILTKVALVKISFAKAMKAGFLIFLPGDLIKSAATAIIASQVVPALSKQNLLKASERK